jgi:hypothetical protein
MAPQLDLQIQAHRTSDRFGNPGVSRLSLIWKSRRVTPQLDLEIPAHRASKLDLKTQTHPASKCDFGNPGASRLRAGLLEIRAHRASKLDF